MLFIHTSSGICWVVLANFQPYMRNWPLLFYSSFTMASVDQVWSGSTSWLSCLFHCRSVACGCRDRCGRTNLCTVLDIDKSHKVSKNHGLFCPFSFSFQVIVVKLCIVLSKGENLAMMISSNEDCSFWLVFGSLWSDFFPSLQYNRNRNTLQINTNLNDLDSRVVRGAWGREVACVLYLAKFSVDQQVKFTIRTWTPTPISKHFVIFQMR